MKQYIKRDHKYYRVIFFDGANKLMEKGEIKRSRDPYYHGTISSNSEIESSFEWDSKL